MTSASIVNFNTYKIHRIYPMFYLRTGKVPAVRIKNKTNRNKKILTCEKTSQKSYWTKRSVFLIKYCKLKNGLSSKGLKRR